MGRSHYNPPTGGTCHIFVHKNPSRKVGFFVSIHVFIYHEWFKDQEKNMGIDFLPRLLLYAHMKNPTLLSSGNISIPYEYRRTGLTKEQASFYNCQNIHYARLFNGEVTEIVTDRWFFNRTHFEVCLSNWNRLAESMAKTPCTLDGKYYHWAYKEIPQ